jgi:hypothetical protein
LNYSGHFVFCVANKDENNKPEITYFNSLPRYNEIMERGLKELIPDAKINLQNIEKQQKDNSCSELASFLFYAFKDQYEVMDVDNYEAVKGIIGKMLNGDNNNKNNQNHKIGNKQILYNHLVILGKTFNENSENYIQLRLRKTNSNITLEDAKKIINECKQQNTNTNAQEYSDDLIVLNTPTDKCCVYNDKTWLEKMNIYDIIYPKLSLKEKIIKIARLKGVEINENFLDTNENRLYIINNIIYPLLNPHRTPMKEIAQHYDLADKMSSEKINGFIKELEGFSKQPIYNHDKDDDVTTGLKLKRQFSTKEASNRKISRYGDYVKTGFKSKQSSLPSKDQIIKKKQGTQNRHHKGEYDSKFSY